MREWQEVTDQLEIDMVRETKPDTTFELPALMHAGPIGIWYVNGKTIRSSPYSEVMMVTDGTVSLMEVQNDLMEIINRDTETLVRL